MDIKTTIKNDCLEILKYFVEKGAKIDFNNYEGVDDIEEEDEDMSPLSLAVKYASESRSSYQWQLRVNIVKFLIEKGCDIHSNDEYPLRKAAIMGDIEIVKLLVENGADVHALHDWALDNAAKHCHLDVVIYLVENGADIHADNNAALLNSVGNGYLEVVKYLVENGANIHVDNENALRTSILESDSDMINYLLEKGAIVNEDIIKIAKSQHKDISNLFKKYY